MTLGVHRLESRESIHAHLRLGHEQVALNVAHMTIDDAENVHATLHIGDETVITYGNSTMMSRA